MQCRPVVQAVTMARLGPLNPYLIDTWPEIMLMIEAGTKNGEMRRGPRAAVLGVGGLDHRQAADARTDDAADALAWSSLSASPVGRPASCTAWIAPRHARSG
jgi:hypothetical protein